MKGYSDQGTIIKNKNGETLTRNNDVLYRWRHYQGLLNPEEETEVQTDQTKVQVVFNDETDIETPN